MAFAHRAFTSGRIIIWLGIALVGISSSDAQTLRRLAAVPADDAVRYTRPSVSADGTTVAAVLEMIGGSRTLTTFTAGGIAFDPSIEGDHPFVNHYGSRIFFDSVAIPLALDGCNRPGIYSIAPDGSGLERRSLPDPTCSVNYVEPRLAENAARMLYRRGTIRETSNLDGSAPQSLPPTGLSIADEVVRIDGDGERVAFSDGFTTGQITPGGIVEILAGSNWAQADLSRDGTQLAFQRWTGNGEQLFVLDTTSGIEEQLTSFPPARIRNVRISPDGVWLFFYTELGSAGLSPPCCSFFRLNRLNGIVERVSGPFPMAWSLPDVEYDISHDGQQIVFADVFRDTPGFSDLYFADLEAPTSIEVTASEQPAVRFPHDPRASTYDVIRGDLAGLAYGGGGEVDLATVLCLADDTPINEAHEPPGDDTPLSGQGFFYLMRVDFRMGSLGAGAETNYGTANPSGDRVPSAGDCTVD